MDRKYSKDDLKVMLAVFTYSGVEEATYESVINEIRWGYANKVTLYHLRVSGDALIARSRSRACGTFLRSDCDVMVMIDHDIEWKPGQAYNLGKTAFETGQVVGGLYCKRAFSKGWASRISPGHAEKVSIGGEESLIESDAVATGFMAIPRSALEMMVDKLDMHGGYYNLALESCAAAGDIDRMQALADMSVCRIKDGAYKKVTSDYYDMFRCFRLPGSETEVCQFLSEDFAFCKRAQFCGIKTYISTAPYLKHYGTYAFKPGDGMDDADRELLKQ